MLCEPVSAALTQLVGVAATGGGQLPAAPDELLEDELLEDAPDDELLLDDELLDDELLDELLLVELLLLELLLDELLVDEPETMSLEDDPPPHALSSASATIGARVWMARQ